MSLTIHQADVEYNITDAIRKGHKRIVLKGSAGVGKTYLVNELVKSLGRNTTFLTAPTNKALAVLRGKIRGNISNISFSTIHSALKLKRKFDKETGDPYFAQEFHPKYPPFKGCRLLVIDEASMLNQMLIDYLSDYDFPIIFIGDEKQLNPVKEEESPVFHQNWLTFELTEIIRQGKGNPIIELSRNIPKVWSKLERVNTDFDGNYSGYTYTHDRNKIIERLAEVRGTDELKYLAWTNSEVDTMNLSVRKRLYGDDPKMIEENETLVFNAPYGDTFYTNKEISVEDVEEYEDDFEIIEGTTIEFKVYRINDEILVVHEDSIKKYRDTAKRLKKDTKNGLYSWPTYYKFIEQFADFKYNHAITVHKSQGSTYKDVILNVGNLNKNFKKKEKQRLFYTGITRASNLLILYNV